MKNSLLKNSIFKAILSFANIVVPLLVGPYIVKLLDVSLYGVYNKVYSEFQLFLTFASFGIYTYGVREISKIRNDKEKISELLTNLFIISFISNILILIIYIIYSFFISSGIELTLYLLMIIQIISNIFYIEFINEALENYKFITIKSVIIKFMYMFSLFIFVKKPTDIIIYSIIICLTQFANNFISYIYIKKQLKFNFKNINLKKYISPLFLVFVITNIDLLYSQLDRVMLGRFVSGVAVTMYYIPYYIVSTLAAIPYAIINVSIPRLSYLIENEGIDNYTKTLNKSVSSLLFVIIPICLGVFVLSKEVIYLYAGENYIEAVPVLMVACITRLIISIESTMINLVMYPNNQEKKIFKISLFCGILNLLFNSICIFLDVFNPLTCILTTCLVEIILSTILYVYIKTKLKIHYNLFTKQNILYLILCILFIPISFLVKLLNVGFLTTILLIIILCVSLYFSVLYMKKDENLFLILTKFFGRVRRKNV